MLRYLPGVLVLLLALSVRVGLAENTERSAELAALVKEYEAELLKVRLRPALPPLPDEASPARPGRRPGGRDRRQPPNRRAKPLAGKRLSQVVSAVKPVLNKIARLEEEAAFNYLALQGKDGPVALKPVLTGALVMSENPKAPSQVFSGFAAHTSAVRLAALETLGQRKFTQFWREHLVRGAPGLKLRGCLVAAVPLLAQVKTLESARNIFRYLAHDAAEVAPDTELGDLAVTALFGMAADEEINAWLKAEAFAMEELSPTRLYVYANMAGGLQMAQDRKRLGYLLKSKSEPIAIAATASLVQLGKKDGAREVARLLSRKRGYELISYRIKLLDAIARSATDSGVEILTRLLKSKDEDLRAVVMGSLGIAANNKSAIEGLVKGLMDNNSRVRASALRSLEGVVKRIGGSAIMIGPLISYLDLEKQHRLRIDALNLLVRVSGHNMGLVTEDWKKWWAEEKNRFVAQTSLEPRHLVLPMFVADGVSEPRPIASMPGVVQHTRDSLRRAAVDAVQAGVGGLMLFGVPCDEHKDPVGSAGTDPDGILNVALRDLRTDVGDATVLMADTCLDEFPHRLRAAHLHHSTRRQSRLCKMFVDGFPRHRPFMEKNQRLLNDLLKPDPTARAQRMTAPDYERKTVLVERQRFNLRV